MDNAARYDNKSDLSFSQNQQLGRTRSEVDGRPNHISKAVGRPSSS